MLFSGDWRPSGSHKTFSVSEHLEDEPDAVRVTRQDILHNRLEQCECAAIELRLEGRHQEAADKLEECLRLVTRLAGDDSPAVWRAANQLGMACNAAAAALLKKGFEHARYEQALALLQRAANVTQPADQPRRLEIRAATHRILSLATKRRRSPKRGSAPTRINRTQPKHGSPPRVLSKSGPDLEVRAVSCPTSPKDSNVPTRLLRKRSPVSGAARAVNTVEWELLVQCHEAKRERAELSQEEQELWEQMEQYWELQHKLEEDFLETLDGPAVNVCGLTVAQLAELQTRELAPEDYEMLLALDEQIDKKTVDADGIDLLESRPVTPSHVTDSCSVCMCEFELDERCKVLPCGHQFHKECISKWLGGCNTKCPNCGYDVQAKP